MGLGILSGRERACDSLNECYLLDMKGVIVDIEQQTGLPTTVVLAEELSPAVYAGPVLSPSKSSTPSLQVPSMPGIPRAGDEEVSQTITLTTLYEIRNRLKQRDSAGLEKAREQIDALIAKKEAAAAIAGREPGRQVNGVEYQGLNVKT
ncbi:hypothetical protein M406DRAFT_330343 [Cryphonectria parasitica EP155]|uniref:Uncharacterized protein n=1 Tax=Cryphonectria parasitica (strain ATCC 38755 / EP155) TaxID=660469 RepID=A0A9P5CQS9_CRYP1|nr:uncharacterized protein M406DRAFT_330343 [Cryphonectria parasitica EP155]KAF3766536.1 hypothetical protein M406DRAFT_330343 [Cryphonectria parasitica EP155]